MNRAVVCQRRYDYIYKCKVEEERYRTNGATYRWCRAGRKASKYIKKHAQEIKIPVLLCQAGKDYLVSNAAEDEFIANCLRALRRSILIQSTRYLMRMMIPWRSFTQISLILGLNMKMKFVK
ncbi:MAG: serine aminopeptidase domain-containing protein [Agathobacter rectalis]